MKNVTAFPTLYLHIGAEKTGSTSIQRFLRKSSSLLRRYDCCYIDFGHPSGFSSCFDSQNLHADLAGSYTSLDAIHSLIDNYLIGGYTNYVISCEYLFSRIRSYADINNLHDFLSKKFERITIIAFYRNPQDLVNSLASEAIKSGHITVWNTKKFLTSDYLQHSLAFHNVLQVWNQVFGDTRVLSYDQALKNDRDLIRTFIRFLDQSILSDEAFLTQPTLSRNSRITYTEALLISYMVIFLDMLPKMKLPVRKKLLAFIRHLSSWLVVLTPARLHRSFKPFNDGEIALSVAFSSRYNLK